VSGPPLRKSPYPGPPGAAGLNSTP
jgi:hypothetical protein